MTANNFETEAGDIWFVRDCDEAGCTVIERHYGPGSIERGEPAQVIDVPAELCMVIGKALIARAAEMEAAANESDE